MQTMRKLLVLAAILAAGQGVGHAQEAATHGGHGAMAHGDHAEAAVPAACQAGGGEMTMPDMSAGAESLTPVQKANHDAMLAMHGPMMQAAMIEDADLAFNCGMIAHHRGAIAMAKVELAMGKDEASRKLAQAIIDAQEKEIAEMTAWVENRTK